MRPTKITTRMKAGKKMLLDWPSGAVGFVFICGRERERERERENDKDIPRKILYQVLLYSLNQDTMHGPCYMHAEKCASNIIYRLYLGC